MLVRVLLISFFFLLLFLNQVSTIDLDNSDRYVVMFLSFVRSEGNMLESYKNNDNLCCWQSMQSNHSGGEELPWAG